MGFTPDFFRLIIKLHKQVHFNGSVLTLGNQDVYASYEDLKSLFDEAHYPYQNLDKVREHTSNFFKEDLATLTQNFVHASVFFEMLGLGQYYDLDKFPEDHPVLLYDLNTPVPQEWHNKFGLVVDSGTSEHIFDVKQVLANTVALTELGGWVIHISPSSNTVDHGFYSFSPTLFYDFYQANGFGDFACYILYLNPQDLLKSYPYFEYSYGMSFDQNLYDPDLHMYVFFVARKQQEVDQIQIPTQGRYIPSAKDNVSKHKLNKLVPNQNEAVNTSDEPANQPEETSPFSKTLQQLREQKALFDEVVIGKAWIEEQLQSWQNEAARLEGIIDEQNSWVKELEEGKKWLEQQLHNWQKETARLQVLPG